MKHLHQGRNKMMTATTPERHLPERSMAQRTLAMTMVLQLLPLSALGFGGLMQEYAGRRELKTNFCVWRWFMFASFWAISLGASAETVYTATDGTKWVRAGD